MTNRDFVSQISSILKSDNKDNYIPDRLILSIGKDAALFLISQKLLDRTLSYETNLYSTIECFEFEKTDVVKCPSIEFRMCKTLMKSKKPLPKLIFSRLGSSIKNVISLDGDFTFSLVDAAQYRRNNKRKNKLKNQIFIYLGTDNHLYIPDKEIYSVTLNILTLDNEDIEDCECNDCKNKWDYEFIVPDKLKETVKDITLQRLSLTKQIIEDPNPNNIENA